MSYRNSVRKGKKIPMPKITIFDFVPHLIMPPNGQSFVGPLETLEPSEPHVEPMKKHRK